MQITLITGISLTLWSCICLKTFYQWSELSLYSQEVASLIRRASLMQSEKKIAEKIREQVLRSKSNYLKDALETLPLLQREKVRVSALAKKFPSNRFLHERLLFLEGSQNRIEFKNISSPLDGYIQYHLSHPVQMDTFDLRKFLEAIEGGRYDLTQGIPFFLIRKLELSKQEEKGGESIYSIQASLLQKI